ncbi:MAG: M14 family metallopeptidase [Oscillospiraceae bacterium]|nr:M14 family metallopeptidase [Oscillospiraceae bacterium]
MRKCTLYSIKSPYREDMDVLGYRFGSGEKSMCIVGALRGNEIQQMYVCSQIIKKLRRLEADGKIAAGHEIMVIPCVNYYSMNIGKRFWTMDNTDINRMFPGYNLGETTQRIADGLFEQIQGYKFGIQFASFYQQGDFLSHVKLMHTGFTDPEKMKDFGLPYAFIRDPRPYDTTTLNYNWQIWETNAFSYFLNSTDDIDEKYAEDAVDNVMRFMVRQGIIKGRDSGGYLTELINEKEVIQIHSTAAGIYRPKVNAGERFSKGDLLCEILDPMEGEVISRVKAPCDGIVFFRYSRPLEFENSVLFKLIPR